MVLTLTGPSFRRTCWSLSRPPSLTSGHICYAFRKKRPTDQLFFDSIREDALADSNLRQAAVANTLENFGYVFRKALEGLFIDRVDQNEDITAKFMNDDRFREAVSRHLLKDVYEKFRSQQTTVP